MVVCGPVLFWVDKPKTAPSVLPWPPNPGDTAMARPDAITAPYTAVLTPPRYYAYGIWRAKVVTSPKGRQITVTITRSSDGAVMWRGPLRQMIMAMIAIDPTAPAMLAEWDRT